MTELKRAVFHDNIALMITQKVCQYEKNKRRGVIYDAAIFLCPERRPRISCPWLSLFLAYGHFGKTKRKKEK